MNRKMYCHGPVSRITWPTLGAMIGTAMKIMKVSDMISAISRPEKRSRTTDVAMTRVAGGAQPLREAQREEDGEGRREGRGEGADQIDREADQQRSAPAEAVGQRAEDELGGAEADHVDADDELALVLVRDAQVLAHIGQGREHHVDGEGVERHQGGAQGQ